MDCMASQSRNEEWLRPLEPARRKRNLGAVRLARRPNVSLIWHANPDCQTGSNLRSPNDNRKDDAPTLPPRPCQPDGARRSSQGQTASRRPCGPALTRSARAISILPRSGRRAGLQSNKELTNRLDTPTPHVSNPERPMWLLDCFVALLLAMTVLRVRLSRSAVFPTLLLLRLGGNPGLHHDRLVGSSFSTVAIEMLAAQLDAVQLGAVRFGTVQPMLFLGLCRQLFGFPQGLSLRLGLQAQPFGPRLGALLLALLFARRASAADRLQIGLEVVGTVIVVDLFARLDVLDGADENLALAGTDVGLRVRLAGVVDIAGDVFAHRPVDGPAVIEFEQIFVLDRVVLLLLAIQQRPEITDDFGALLDRFGGEEAKPGRGTADAIRFFRRNGRHDG